LLFAVLLHSVRSALLMFAALLRGLLPALLLFCCTVCGLFCCAACGLLCCCSLLCRVASCCFAAVLLRALRSALLLFAVLLRELEAIRVVIYRYTNTNSRMTSDHRRHRGVVVRADGAVDENPFQFVRRGKISTVFY
jgi:hypothetical protein